MHVCVSEEKTRKERNHILDFLLDTRFIILLLFLWQNFICRARREDVKAFSVRFYRRLLVCGCQEYDNVDGSRRGVVNSFILYLFSTLSGGNKFRVFKISRLSCSAGTSALEPISFGHPCQILLLSPTILPIRLPAMLSKLNPQFRWPIQTGSRSTRANIPNGLRIELAVMRWGGTLKALTQPLRVDICYTMPSTGKHFSNCNFIIVLNRKPSWTSL